MARLATSLKQPFEAREYELSPFLPGCLGVQSRPNSAFNERIVFIEMLWLNGVANEIWDATQNELCMGDDVPASPEIKARERCAGPGSKPYESVKMGLLYGWRPSQVHATSSHGAQLYIQMVEEAMMEGNYSVEADQESLIPAIKMSQARPDRRGRFNLYPFFSQLFHLQPGTG